MNMRLHACNELIEITYIGCSDVHIIFQIDQLFIYR